MSVGYRRFTIPARNEECSLTCSTSSSNHWLKYSFHPQDGKLAPEVSCATEIFPALSIHAAVGISNKQLPKLLAFRLAWWSRHRRSSIPPPTKQALNIQIWKVNAGLALYWHICGSVSDTGQASSAPLSWPSLSCLSKSDAKSPSPPGVAPPGW